MIRFATILLCLLLFSSLPAHSRDRHTEANAGHESISAVVCDQTPAQGMAPYAPDMCRDPLSGGQISRKYLEDNPRYAEKVRKKLEEDARQKQGHASEFQRSLAIQREISPSVNGCSSPSIASRGMCLAPGNCDDLRSGGQVPCSSLTSAQLEELKKKGVETSREYARGQQEYLDTQAALANKLGEDKARIDRGVEESARQNAKQHGEYAKQNQISQESWAAYQRKAAEDRARFDAEQKKQQAKQTALQNAEIEKQRLATDAWNNNYRETQARNAASTGNTSVTTVQQPTQKPVAQAPQGITQQATSGTSTAPVLPSTGASYTSLTQTLLQGAAQQSQNGQSSSPVSPGLGTTTPSTSQPSSNTQQNKVSTGNAKSIAKTEFVYDCNHFPGQGALGRSYTDNERKFVADCGVQSARTTAEINASNQRIDTGIKIAEGVQKSAEIAGTGIAVVTGVADGALLARGAYAVGKTIVEKRAMTATESAITRGVDAASTDGINKTITKGVSVGFGNEAKLLDHFNRHGSDFGAKTATEYATRAENFLISPLRKGALEKVRTNGDIVRFDPATDEFGVISSKSILKTYYKPNPAVHGKSTNLDYFNAQ